MNTFQSRPSPLYRLSADPLKELFRRGLEVALTGLALLLLWPLLALMAVAVALDSPGPVLFRQERLGKGGKTFTLLKFRTMQASAETRLAELLAVDAAQRQIWRLYQKLPDDPRTTIVGRFLRRFSLDELPQLINILRGEMSLVGPRPILPEQRDIYGAAYAGYVLARPGLTGLWQVNGRNRTTFAERVRWDQLYLERRSLLLDAAILLRTVGVALRGDGVH